MTDVISSFLDSITVTRQIVPKVYSKIALSNKSKAKLLQYQEKHVVRLINILLRSWIAFDGSDTGVGKTYTAAAVCKELDRIPIVIGPKTLLHNYRNVFEYMEVKVLDIVNYETITRGKTYAEYSYTSRKTAPYLTMVEPDPTVLNHSVYQWNLPANAIIIIDEGHRCKHTKTRNGKLLMSLLSVIKKQIPVLILSATIYEKFCDMQIPFYLFGLIPHVRNYQHYVKTIKHKYPQHHKSIKDKSQKDQTQALIIYEEIKEFTSRIRIKDLGDKFPSNQICAQQFVAEGSEEIAKAYGKIAKIMAQMKKFVPTNHLARIQKLKQEIELRKVPIFVEQTQLYVDEGKSVIIFVNYLATLRILCSQLAIRCKVYGSQTLAERQEAIDLFQSNKERIIILQMRAGGVGLSLHDLDGHHPRVSLINFPDSGSDLLQALGRAARSGAKSPVLQRIIFVANVEYEKKIMQNISRKLINISAINDGDLNGHRYQVTQIIRKEKHPK